MLATVPNKTKVCFRISQECLYILTICCDLKRKSLKFIMCHRRLILQENRKENIQNNQLIYGVNLTVELNFFKEI